jgi:hypothetical protein
MYFKQLYLQGLYFYLFDTKYKIFYWQGGGGGLSLLLSGGKRLYLLYNWRLLEAPYLGCWPIIYYPSFQYSSFFELRHDFLHIDIRLLRIPLAKKAEWPEVLSNRVDSSEKLSLENVYRGSGIPIPAIRPWPQKKLAWTTESCKLMAPLTAAAVFAKGWTQATSLQPYTVEYLSSYYCSSITSTLSNY